jgi:hypothetical protein
MAVLSGCSPVIVHLPGLGRNNTRDMHMPCPQPGRPFGWYGVHLAGWSWTTSNFHRMTRSIYAALLSTLFLTHTSTSQYAPVVYDPTRGLLHEGQPLPAEDKWTITGPVQETIGLVEARVYEDAGMKRHVATGRWERSAWSSAVNFNIPMDQLLRGNTQYTIELGFYEAIGTEAAEAIVERLVSYLDAYLEENVEFSSNRTRLKKPVRQMMEEMDILVERGLSEHRSRLGQRFAGFSQLVEDQLRGLNETRLSAARFAIKKKEDESDRDRRIEFGRQRMATMQQIVDAEVRMHMAQEAMVLRERALFTDQRTERTMNTLAVNLGYGGIYNSGTTDDLSYGQAPFAGLSFPLGRRAFSSRFLSNSSLSAGVFLQNTEDENGLEVTGPLVGRPLYAAYGYRLFHMIRLNAGYTLLQKDTPQIDGGSNTTIYGSPFIGISLELNLWLGFGK